jgi:hypothetical protein
LNLKWLDATTADSTGFSAEEAQPLYGPYCLTLAIFSHRTQHDGELLHGNTRVVFSLSSFRCVVSESSCFHAARHPIRPVVALHCTFARFCRITPTVTISTYNTRVSWSNIVTNCCRNRCCAVQMCCSAMLLAGAEHPVLSGWPHAAVGRHHKPCMQGLGVTPSACDFCENATLLLQALSTLMCAHCGL